MYLILSYVTYFDLLEYFRKIHAGVETETDTTLEANALCNRFIINALHIRNVYVKIKLLEGQIPISVGEDP